MVHAQMQDRYTERKANERDPYIGEWIEGLLSAVIAG